MLDGGEPHLSSSWVLWGGVGREAGTSTVLELWFRDTSSSPFFFFTPAGRERKDYLDWK